MGRGIRPQLAFVTGRSDHLSAAGDDGPDRDVPVLGGALGLAQGEPHEVLIAAKEPWRVHGASINTSAADACYKLGMAVRLANVLTLALAGLALVAPSAPAANLPYAPGQVLFRYKGAPHESELKLPRGDSVPQAVKRLRADPSVAYANPDYVVTAAAPFPNDPGRGGPGDWTKDQWNFLASAPGGVDVPGAWHNLILRGSPGATGVTVAVLDTGVAYRSQGQRFRRDPDLPVTDRFVDPKDFVDGDAVPLDEAGHGTHVTSTIAQSTNNGLGLTGIAYGARVMPVRVLNRQEHGTGKNVARGIRYADSHGADVINLSLEFKPAVKKCSQIPSVCAAVHQATRDGVVVVAAAGNRHRARVAFPAAAPGSIAVGATTYRSCLAAYSDYGTGLDLVAPGGGADTRSVATGNGSCAPSDQPYAIRQFSLKPGAAAQGDFRKFGIVGLQGTSMAAAHVSGVAAMVIAADHTSPGIVDSTLRQCADPIGAKKYYGAGLLDAGRATSLGGC
jgi:serine protease